MLSRRIISPSWGLPRSSAATFTAGEDRPGGPKVVVLSDKLWRNAFLADPGILGKTITLDGQPYSVIGVMPPGLVFHQECKCGFRLLCVIRRRAITSITISA